MSQRLVIQVQIESIWRTGMLVEDWEGQVEEARWLSTYDTEDRVIFHGLELIQSYLEQFTSEPVPRRMCFLQVYQFGRGFR